MQRTAPIDLLRGFIMVLMAIDHASAMIARTHFTEVWGLAFKGYPDLGWWLARFLSHLCAPGFFFLMGMSVFLFSQSRSQKGWKQWRIKKYLWKRAGIIILLMYLLEFPAWGLGNLFKAAEGISTEGLPLPGSYTGGFILPTTVLYGLASCMFIGSFLWKLPKVILLGISLLSFGISGSYISFLSTDTPFHPIEVLTLVPGFSNGAMSLYPIIPWIGVTAFGILWGRLLHEQKERIYPISLFTGLTMIVLFFILRSQNIGNFHMNQYDDFISFFTLIKYPPSITFALITCGINLILFYLFSRIKSFPPLRLFGQTAMFFYIAHLYLYALIGAFFPYGTSIYVMYGLWLLGLVMLYFICDRYLKFKKGKPTDSIWKMI